MKHQIKKLKDANIKKIRIKKILALFMVGVLLMTFYSCSGFFAPERVAMRFMNRISNGNIWGAQRLTVERSLNLDRRARALYRPLFGSIQYGISDVVVEGGVAHVSIAVQAIDLNLIMTEVSADVTRIMLTAGPQRSSRDLFYALLQERLRSPNLPTFNFSATARLVRIGGRWRVDLRGSEGLADAITGGMGQIIGYARFL